MVRLGLGHLWGPVQPGQSACWVSTSSPLGAGTPEVTTKDRGGSRPRSRSSWVPTGGEAYRALYWEPGPAPVLFVSCVA